MAITIRAVYEKGVLRPTEPLTFGEGETVDLIIAPRNSGVSPVSPVQPPTSAEEEYARRIKSVCSLGDLYKVMATAPQLAEGYDLCQALNANRKATGERLLYAEASEENTP